MDKKREVLGQGAPDPWTYINLGHTYKILNNQNIAKVMLLSQLMFIPPNHHFENR